MPYIIKPGTNIEFDPNKNDSNYDDHFFELGCMGDIVESMLYGRIFSIFSDEYEKNGEQRFAVMAEYQGVIIYAACTWRNEGNTIRVISFRHAHEDERQIYYDEARKLLEGGN